MKKLMCLLFIAISFSTISFSQDLITKKNGEEIKAKILEVTQSEIKYKNFDQQSGPLFTIQKSEIFMIRYENGTKDILNSKNSPDISTKAVVDAKANYKGKNSGAGWTTAATVVFSPVLGVIPAAICSSNEPDDENLNIPDNELTKNSEYKKAYAEQAHKIKKKKVWTNFGIGSGAWVLLILLL
jgi:hypothetical protein